jgi:DNA-binding transcriptional LysR family regulator
VPEPFAIGVVTGVTPDRWVRVWRDRLPDVPLRILPVDDVREALQSGVVMVFARLPLGGGADDDVHAIPLWDETPVVVAPKNHPVKLFDAVTEADIADEELYPGWDDAVLDIVAAGHGIARMPQSVFRATGRRDVVARPISDAEPTRVGLVWLRSTTGELVDEFIGIVRGRTANSSRGVATPPQPGSERSAPKKAARPEQKRPAQKAKPKPKLGKRYR